MSTNNSLKYYDIAKSNLNNAQNIFDKLQGMSEGVYFPQDAENLEYLRTRSSIFDCCLISITFSALFVEAAVNIFGEVYLGSKYYYEYLDKLDTKSKLQVIERMVTHGQIDKGGEFWFDLTFLIKLRNEIVHHKSKSDEQHIIDPSIPLSNAKRSFKTVCNVGNFVYFRKDARIIAGFDKFE